MTSDGGVIRPAIELLADPDAFFRRRASSASLLGPTIVVLLVAAVGIVGSLPLIRATTGALPAGAGPVGAFIVVSSAIGGLVGMLLAWVAYAAAFHVISALAFGADGGFRTTLALTGWGFVPRLPEGILSAAITTVVFGDASVPTDPLAAQRLVQALQNDPLFAVASWLGLVFLLWSAMLWTFAVRHGRALTLRQAALTVSVPVGVRVVILLLGQAGVLGGFL